ncbi:MAG: glycerophosphodiester phosphodiesterase family protein [Bacteroidetes bacterium]|nr:glycerophosphodiester phosphodiesterase family protein [Bacteroidota bacterium]
MGHYVPRPTAGEPPYVIAHRGISAKAPENTLAAFRKAAQVPGIDMIELDVRLSKDNEVIVLHDRTLQRTTTGNGPARWYTVEELKQFDAGSWFHPSFASERIPTLREVLHVVGKQVWVNIEIKSDLFHREEPDSIAQRVLAVVNECDMLHRVLISSFDHSIVASIKRHEPRCITGVLYNMVSNFLLFPSTIAQRVGAHVFVCARHELRSWMLNDAHRHGIAVYVYTLDSVTDALHLMERGVDGILSNCADDLVPILKRSTREST